MNKVFIGEIKDSTLKSYWSKMTKTKSKTLPMGQGFAINMLISKYKIKPVQFAYGKDLIGIETEKQKLIWKDKGMSIEFVGLINK